MIVPDGHKSYINAEFNKYYKKNDIIPVYLPPYSLYLTQPLDVSLFSLLKRVYDN